VLRLHETLDDPSDRRLHRDDGRRRLPARGKTEAEAAKANVAKELVNTREKF
jgi:hypothetical protein